MTGKGLTNEFFLSDCVSSVVFKAASTEEKRALVWRRRHEGKVVFKL